MTRPKAFQWTFSPLLARASQKPTTPKKKEPKPGRDPDGERVPPKEPEDDSGATAGRGAAAGSNKSPASSPWSSKDQVVSEDEEDLEQDEEVDDEFDDSDAPAPTRLIRLRGAILILVLLGVRHPPTANDHVPLGRGRVVLGWLTLAFILVGFTPSPFPV